MQKVVERPVTPPKVKVGVGTVSRSLKCGDSMLGVRQIPCHEK